RELGVVEPAQDEGDVERRVHQGRLQVFLHAHAIGGIGAEHAPVERAVHLPEQRLGAGARVARLDQPHLGELGAGDARQRLDHPARLQRRVGEDAYAQLFRLAAVGKRYSRHTRSPSRRSAAAAGSASHSLRRTPYSCSASSALACGSCTKVSTPNSCSSRMMSMTLELRMSGTSSLKVSPRMLTRAPLMLRPAWIICCTVLRAMCGPIESLMRRPAVITSGW